jgi:hypothetical protein
MTNLIFSDNSCHVKYGLVQLFFTMSGAYACPLDYDVLVTRKIFGSCERTRLLYCHALVGFGVTVGLP